MNIVKSYLLFGQFEMKISDIIGDSVVNIQQIDDAIQFEGFIETRVVSLVKGLSHNHTIQSDGYEFNIKVSIDKRMRNFLYFMFASFLIMGVFAFGFSDVQADDADIIQFIMSYIGLTVLPFIWGLIYMELCVGKIRNIRSQ